MKSFQSLTATLALAISFAACNNSPTTDSAAKADSTAVSTVNASEENNQKLEANKTVVRNFVQSLYGDKDSTAIEKYIADDVKQHNPLLQDGKAWLKTTLGVLLRNPNIEKSKVDIKQIIAEGDQVFVLVREVAPNGKVFARAEIFRIKDGKIVENWLVLEPEPKKSSNKNSMF